MTEVETGIKACIPASIITGIILAVYLWITIPEPTWPLPMAGAASAHGASFDIHIAHSNDEGIDSLVCDYRERHPRRSAPRSFVRDRLRASANCQ